MEGISTAVMIVSDSNNAGFNIIIVHFNGDLSVF